MEDEEQPAKESQQQKPDVPPKVNSSHGQSAGSAFSGLLILLLIFTIGFLTSFVYDRVFLLTSAYEEQIFQSRALREGIADFDEYGNFYVKKCAPAKAEDVE